MNYRRVDFYKDEGSAGNFNAGIINVKLLSLHQNFHLKSGPIMRLIQL